MVLPGCGRAQQPSADDQEFLWTLASGEDGKRNTSAEPLYSAIIKNDLGKVQQLLKDGASANALLSPGRWSPLMVAAEVGNSRIVADLLAHGADVNYVAEDRHPTALDVALTFGVPREDLTIFRELLDKGADINLAYPQHGDIALHAVVIGQMDLVYELIARGCRRDLNELHESLRII
jgi:ankyrin repeat protein